MPSVSRRYPAGGSRFERPSARVDQELRAPVVLMVSGGADSTALLVLAATSSLDIDDGRGSARIARERLETALADALGAPDTSGVDTFLGSLPPPASGMSEGLFFSNEKCYNNMFGHKACNRVYFEAKYPQLRFRYAVDPTLKNNEYKVRLSFAESVPKNKKEI